MTSSNSNSNSSIYQVSHAHEAGASERLKEWWLPILAKPARKSRASKHGCAQMEMLWRWTTTAMLPKNWLLPLEACAVPENLRGIPPANGATPRGYARLLKTLHLRARQRRLSERDRDV